MCFGKDKILYRTIKADRLSSIILFGPPGCGKTSLARVISETTKYKFYKINAVTAGVADIKKVIEETKNFMLNPTGKSILFIDEIHRFNKLQQDALLPYVENGTIILIGATTENPYFEVNKALISRSMVIKLNPLTEENIYQILKNAIKRKIVAKNNTKYLALYTLYSIFLFYELIALNNIQMKLFKYGILLIG